MAGGWGGWVFASAIILGLTATGCAKTGPEKHTTVPTKGERVMQDAVTGQLSEMGSSHVSITQTGGHIRHLRVDSQTKMDQIAKGDYVKAFVTDDGYASTIQRVGP
ncbi:MAG: exported protein of unknown function [Nitrospira sp.]